jgi:hypothetical protein
MVGEDIDGHRQSWPRDSGALRRPLALPPYTLFVVWKRLPDPQWVLYLSLGLSMSAFAMASWHVIEGAGTWRWPTAEAFNNVTSGISSIVTALAVVFGGAWAYFKFVRGRTFKTRLSVDIVGEWRSIDEGQFLQVRVTVKNIGETDFHLNRDGTGVRVSFPSQEQQQQERIYEGDAVDWESICDWPDSGEDQPEGRPTRRCLSILAEHEWIEPGETVSDDLLIHLVREPTICLLEASVRWGQDGRQEGEIDKDSLEFYARRIITPKDKIIGQYEIGTGPPTVGILDGGPNPIRG